MPCKIEYSCKKKILGTMVHHNVIINDDKWHLPENTGRGSGMSEVEVTSKIAATKCRESELSLIGLAKGWIHDC